MFNSTNGTQFMMPVAPTTNNGFGTGFGDNGLFWLIVIILLFSNGGWGNNWGNNGRSTSVYEGYVLNNDMSQISRQISDTTAMTERKLDSVTNGLCDGFYTTAQQINGLNTAILTSTNGIQSQLAQCCCDNRAATADVKYTIGSTGADISRGVERGFADTNFNMSTLSNGITTAISNGFCQTNFNAQTNTRDIVDSQNAGTQAILARIDAMESSRKDEKIAELTAMNSDLRLAASQQAQNNYLVSQLKTPQAIPAYVVPNPYCNCNCNNGCGC